MNGVTTILAGAEKLEQREYALPDPEPGEVLLETVRANVCGSEIHIWRGHHPVVVPGCCMGHEGVGRVLKQGAGADRDSTGAPLAEGDLVTATYFQMCRRCPECNRGDWNLCRNGYQWWGSQADAAPHFHGTWGSHYYVHRDMALFKLPDGVSPKAAAPANCAISQMVYSVHKSEVLEGETIVIQGAGGLGLCAAAAARERGAHVVVTDFAAGRLEAATRFGANVVVDLSGVDTAEDRLDAVVAACGGSKPDVVVEVTGVPSVFQEGAKLVRPGGRFVSVGNITVGKNTDFDPGSFTRSGVTILSAIRYPLYFLGKTLDFIARHPNYPWESLIDADYPLEEAHQALVDSAARTVTRASFVLAS